MTDEKDKEDHPVVLACVMASFGHFAWMKKFVFFCAWKEACFCFRKMTMAVNIGLRSRDNVTVDGICFATT